MELSDKEFINLCEKISKDIYNFARKRIERELISNSFKSEKDDCNLAINFIITSLAAFDGNIIMMIKKMFKSTNHTEISMEKLMTHYIIVMNDVINKLDQKEKLN